MKLIHIPFDEQRTEKRAYDITDNNRHATLKGGGYFTVGTIGNSFFNDGVAQVKVPMQLLNIANDFTLMFFMEYKEQFSLTFKYVDNGIIKDVILPISKTAWNHFALIRSGNDITIYLNFELLYTSAITDFTEFGIYDNDTTNGTLDLVLDGVLGGEIAMCKFDDLIVYNTAHSITSITEYYAPKEVVIDYFINGVNFKDFGVWVSDSSPINGLEVKTENDVDFANMNGFVPSNQRFKKEREVTLDCFIRANDNIGLAITFKDFIDMLQKEYLNRLQINVIDHKPLIYDVFIVQATDLKKRWTQNEVFGTFTLKLIEPFSSKVVLAYNGVGKPRLVIKTNRVINIKGDEVGYIKDIDARNGYTFEPTFISTGIKYITIQNLESDAEILYNDFSVIWKSL